MKKEQTDWVIWEALDVLRRAEMSDANFRSPAENMQIAEQIAELVRTPRHPVCVSAGAYGPRGMGCAWYAMDMIYKAEDAFGIRRSPAEVAELCAAIRDLIHGTADE
jgi:hypothetical protein